MTIFRIMGAAALVFITWAILDRAWSHEIYTNIHGKDGQWCCNEGDCFATIYEEKGATFFIKTREGDSAILPSAAITFLPIPGDIDDGRTKRAHLCYSNSFADTAYDGKRFYRTTSGRQILFYCAFIAPTGS